MDTIFLDEYNNRVAVTYENTNTHQNQIKQNCKSAYLTDIFTSPSPSEIKQYNPQYNTYNIIPLKRYYTKKNFHWNQYYNNNSYNIILIIPSTNSAGVILKSKKRRGGIFSILYIKVPSIYLLYPKSITDKIESTFTILKMYPLI